MVTIAAAAAAVSSSRGHLLFICERASVLYLAFLYLVMANFLPRRFLYIRSIAETACWAEWVNTIMIWRARKSAKNTRLANIC